MIESSNTLSQIQTVSSFSSLVSTPFVGNVNAICWNRKLIGNFSEIITKIEPDENIISIETEELIALNLSEQGQVARRTILYDLKLLEDHGALPTLNIIKSYDRDTSFFPTDVYSFHVDRSPVPSDTFLCTYHGEASEIIANSDTDQKIHIAEIRTKLKEQYTGEEEDFGDFLTEYFYDLHYQAKPNTKPIKLKIGQLWRLAIDHPKSKVPPCVHRAPLEKPGEPRLMIIC